MLIWIFGRAYETDWKRNYIEEVQSNAIVWERMESISNAWQKEIDQNREKDLTIAAMKAELEAFSKEIERLKMCNQSTYNDLLTAQSEFHGVEADRQRIAQDIQTLKTQIRNDNNSYRHEESKKLIDRYEKDLKDMKLERETIRDDMVKVFVQKEERIAMLQERVKVLETALLRCCDQIVRVIDIKVG